MPSSEAQWLWTIQAKHAQAGHRNCQPSTPVSAHRFHGDTAADLLYRYAALVAGPPAQFCSWQKCPSRLRHPGTVHKNHKFSGQGPMPGRIDGALIRPG